MNDEERRPIGDVLPGFTLHPLDAAWTPLQAFVLVKSFDEEGETAWAFRTSEPMNLEELLGALSVQVEVLRRKLSQAWESGDDGSSSRPASRATPGHLRRQEESGQSPSVRTAETPAGFEGFVLSRGLELSRLDVASAIDLVTDWYRTQRIDDVTAGGDDLLFQWVTYDWGEGPSFQFDLTRQLIVAEEVDDDAIWQLHLTLHYHPDARLGEGTEWWSEAGDVDTFRDQILASPVVDGLRGRAPERVELQLDQAG